MASNESIPQPTLKEMLQDAVKDLHLTETQLERVYTNLQTLGIEPYTYAIRLRLGYEIAMEQVREFAATSGGAS